MTNRFPVPGILASRNRFETFSTFREVGMKCRFHRGASIYFLVLSVCALFSFTRASDIDDLRARWTTDLLQRLDEGSGAAYLGAVDVSTAASYLSSQKSDGSWGDLNYDDRDKASWDPYTHLDRLISMAAAYKTSGNSLHNNSNLKSMIVEGVKYWNQSHPTSGNRFKRYIGAPMRLMTVVTLMHGDIPQSVLDDAIDYCDDGVYVFNKTCYTRGSKCETGADVVRLGRVHILIGLETNKPEYIQTASTRMQAECFLSDPSETGIQHDFSYHYHGPQLYLPGYAWTFFGGFIEWAGLLGGSPWAFDRTTSMPILRDVILDGFHWFGRRGAFDQLANGRSIARKSYDLIDNSFKRALVAMKNADPENAAKYQDYLDHVKGTNDGALVGNKHFFNSDYTSHRRSDFTVAVRMSSKRFLIQECGNNENVKNRFLSQGAMVTLVDGDEYHNIYPWWDWWLIPGVTAPEQKSKLKTGDWTVSGNTDFVGGVSNGTYGTTAFDLDWEGVTGKKSWFFFDDAVIALGSGIKSAEKVNTCVNSCRKDGDVYVSSGTGTPTKAGETDDAGTNLTNPTWVHHDKVGYFFPQNTSLVLKNQSAAEASWKDINPGEYPNDQVETKARFSLYIDHGTGPSNAEYVYGVVPGKNRQEFETAYSSVQNITVLQNNQNVQAVRDPSAGVTGIVFWDAGKVGSVDLHDNLTIGTDNNAIVLVHEKPGGGIDISVSHPYQNPTVNITVTLGTSGSQVLTFDLPGSPYFGKSVTKSLSFGPPTISSAASTGDKSVQVVFDQIVTSATAENTSNFSLSPSIGVTEAALSSDGSAVTLTLASAMTIGTEYTVSANGIVGGFTSTPGGGSMTFVHSNEVQIQVASVDASNSQTGYEPSNLIDGSLSQESRWSADGDGEWAQLNLPDVYTITSIKAAFFKGDERKTIFDIQTSMDGSSWSTIATGLQSSGTTLDLEAFDIADTDAQYVRLVGHGNTSNTWNSIVEVELYGTPGQSSILARGAVGAAKSMLVSLRKDRLVVRAVDGAARGTVNLFDLKGNRLQSHALADGTLRISLGGISSGVYLMSIAFEDGAKSVRRLTVK